jgi:hypothetical protein
VGQATDQARHQVELTRVALAADIDKLERRIRAELDWKARLRREGPQIAAIAGAVVVVAAGGYMLRRRFGRGGVAGAGAGAADAGALSLEELTRELRALREELEGKRKSGTSDGSQPLWMKVAIRAATAAAAGGASMAARRYARHAQDASEAERVH